MRGKKRSTNKTPVQLSGPVSPAVFLGCVVWFGHIGSDMIQPGRQRRPRRLNAEEMRRSARSTPAIINSIAHFPVLVYLFLQKRQYCWICPQRGFGHRRGIAPCRAPGSAMKIAAFRPPLFFARAKKSRRRSGGKETRLAPFGSAKGETGGLLRHCRWNPEIFCRVRYTLNEA